MNKTMFLRVYNADALDDPPALARVQFTDELIKRIHKMADIVNSQPAVDIDIYTVDCFNYAPDWYESQETEDYQDVPECDFKYGEELPGFVDAVNEILDGAFPCETDGEEEGMFVRSEIDHRYLDQIQEAMGHD